MPLGPAREAAVAADWKVVVEQWLESAAPAADAESGGGGRSPGPCARRARKAAGVRNAIVGWRAPAGGGAWHERFIAPNQLLQWRPDGVSIMQVIPAGPGRCRVRRLDYAPRCARRATRARPRTWPRGCVPGRGARPLRPRESAQSGMVDFGYRRAPEGRSCRRRSPGFAASSSR